MTIKPMNPQSRLFRELTPDQIAKRDHAGPPPPKPRRPRPPVKRPKPRALTIIG